MKLLLALTLCTTALAAPPRVRLLSVSDNTGLIRLADGSPEAKITSLVDSLHNAGINSFTFETKSDRLLEKLKPIWLDSGIKTITIKEPTPPSSFPKLDPVTARAILAGIDKELERETTRFETHRKALVTFVFHHGIPEIDDTISLENLAHQKQEAEEQLAPLLNSPLNTRLILAAKVEIAGNPVAKHLKSHQKANQQKAHLMNCGFGLKHPDIIATSQEVDTTHQLAIDELGSIEEALRVRIYQLGKRAKHLETWQQLPQDKRDSREQSYQEAKDSYDNSLRRIQEMAATKKAAQRSLNR